MMNRPAPAFPEPYASPIYKTIGEVELRLHIFYPEGHQRTDRRPAIVFFFGGGWNGGSPEQFTPFCAHLASRGMVGISAEYRTYSLHRTPPSACVKDGKSAMRWVRAHAGELGIDPEKLAAGGGSAGAQVAAATATSRKIVEEGEDLSVSCKPTALVLFNPVIDNGPGGYGHDRVKACWEDFSPLHNLDKTTPPTVFFLGTADKLIPVATAKAYQTKMEAEGGRCDLHLHPGQEHGFFNFRFPENYRRVLPQMDAFLVSLGYLEKKEES